MSGGCLFCGSDGVHVFPLLQFDIQQAHIYCSAELAVQEGCCEISASGVSISLAVQGLPKALGLLVSPGAGGAKGLSLHVHTWLSPLWHPGTTQGRQVTCPPITQEACGQSEG